ncbi:MAG: ribosomal RNA small subunit methyltransferase A, partial [Deltaproteobacteria bacterium]|nr:ribosomal RNA small subunit methyltransferase A [Deltaproteobacteria bacterium]
LGQSFLVDNNITSRIVDSSGVGDKNTVVEIGAGLGAMTAMIAPRVKRIIALEIDPKLVDVLDSELGEIPNIEILSADVLRYDFSSPLQGRGKIRVIGNIPYNVSSQIIFRLIEFRKHISSATLMLPREVADRITASPGTKQYGIPSVIVSMYAAASQLMTVPATCFYPVPKVDSAVLRMEMCEGPLYPLGDPAVFLETVKAAFAMRRKTLANNLKGMASVRSRGIDIPSLLAIAGIDGRRRGETLTVEELGRLSEIISRMTEPS